MSRHIHDTSQIEQMQRAAQESDLWNTEVVPRLPPDLDTQARSLKAFVRVREVKCATDLLRAARAEHFDLPSLTDVLVVTPSKPHTSTFRARNLLLCV